MPKYGSAKSKHPTKGLIGVVVRCNGDMPDVHPKDKKKFTLEEIYRHIGRGCNTFERLHVTAANCAWKGWSMLMDENGKLTGNQPFNPMATAMVPGHVIVGDVLLVKWGN